MHFSKVWTATAATTKIIGAKANGGILSKKEQNDNSC
jgi:hypothetical protein